jgi:tRNA pseudouridine13 synthase
MFASDDPATDQHRLEDGELAITGPMFGHKMRCPPNGSEAGAREDSLLAEEGIELASFARMGKLATGTRRPYSVDLGQIGVEPAGERAIALSFRLPAGSYATVVAAEVVKPRRS